MTAAEILARADIRERVYAHAMTWFPKECCGLLLAGVDGPECLLLDNLLDAAHASDPERFPRTGDDGYLLDGREIEDADARGQRVVAIFHSHVRVGAYFSDEDRAQAMAPWDEPLYPGVEYVVLDARDAGVEGFKTFGWSEDAQDFVAS